MKLTASRIDLIKAIGAAVRVVESRSNIVIVRNLLLRAEGGQLAIRATDLGIEISTRCAATVLKPGATTVPAATFHDVLRKLPEGAEVSIEAQDGKGTLRAGRARCVLQTLPDSDFPDITAGEMSHRFEVPAADLATMFTQVGFAVSTEETRYSLNGIYLHATEGESAALIAVVSCMRERAREWHSRASVGASLFLSSVATLGSRAIAASAAQARDRCQTQSRGTRPSKR